MPEPIVIIDTQAQVMVNMQFGGGEGVRRIMVCQTSLNYINKL